MPIFAKNDDGTPYKKSKNGQNMDFGKTVKK